MDQDDEYAERQERLIQIFETEIDREIADKMVAVGEITDNIRECQRSMDRLRKEAVIKFYTDLKKKPKATEQPSIHPAVKKLVGKRPREISQTEDFLETNVREWKRLTRKKVQRNHALMIPKRKPNKVPDHHTTTLNNGCVKRPCYIPPKLPGNPQENSSFRGNTSKLHMRVLVGNVARAVEADPDDAATHKWMVYVRSAPGSLSAEKEVSKVRFFLHPSYKPNDVITVPNPPFILSRRGWGEFPMRVQLFFKNHLNKTVDIIHSLKLNGSQSGFHVRSAETFADLWIYPRGEDMESLENDSDESRHILSLASDILHEEVPDFTSELRCHKCQRTTIGLDESCYCNAKPNRPDASECSFDQTDCESHQLSSEEESMSSQPASQSESVCSSPACACRSQITLVDGMAEAASSFKREDAKNEESNLIFGLNKEEGSPIFDSWTTFERDFKLDPMEFLNLKDTDIFDALEINQKPPGADEHAGVSGNHCTSTVNGASGYKQEEQEAVNKTLHIKVERDVDIFDALKINQKTPGDDEHGAVLEKHCPSSVNGASGNKHLEQKAENKTLCNIKPEKDEDIFYALKINQKTDDKHAEVLGKIFSSSVNGAFGKKHLEQEAGNKRLCNIKPEKDGDIFDALEINQKTQGDDEHGVVLGKHFPSSLNGAPGNKHLEQEAVNKTLCDIKSERDYDIFDALKVNQKTDVENAVVSGKHCPSSVNGAPSNKQFEQGAVNQMLRNINWEIDSDKVFPGDSAKSSELKEQEKSEPVIVKEEPIEISDELVETEVVLDYDNFEISVGDGSFANDVNEDNVDLVSMKSKYQIPQIYHEKINDSIILPENSSEMKNLDVVDETLVSVECMNNSIVPRTSVKYLKVVEDKLPLSVENLNDSIVLETPLEVKDLDVEVEETPIPVNDFLESIVKEKQDRTINHALNNVSSAFKHCAAFKDEKADIRNSIDGLNETQKYQRANNSLLDSNSLLQVSSVNLGNISSLSDPKCKLVNGKKLINSRDCSSSIVQNKPKMQSMIVLNTKILPEKVNFNQRVNVSNPQTSTSKRPNTMLQTRQESILLSSIRNTNSLLKPSVKKSIDIKKKGHLMSPVTEPKLNGQYSSIASNKYCVVLPRSENSPRASFSKNTVIVNRPNINNRPRMTSLSFQPKLQSGTTSNSVLIENKASLTSNSSLVSKSPEATIKIPSVNAFTTNVSTTAVAKSPLKSLTYVPNTVTITSAKNSILMRSVLNSTNLSPVVRPELLNKGGNPFQPIKPEVLIKTALSSPSTSTSVTSNVQKIQLPCPQTNLMNRSSPVRATARVENNDKPKLKIINNIIQTKQIMRKSEIKNICSDKKLNSSNTAQELLGTYFQRNLINIKRKINMKGKSSPSNDTFIGSKVEGSSSVTICELCKILRIDHPVSKKSTSYSGVNQVQNPYLERTFSCNNTHSNLRSIDFLQPTLLLDKKLFAVNKEHINYILNDRMLFYLEQLR